MQKRTVMFQCRVLIALTPFLVIGPQLVFGSMDSRVEASTSKLGSALIGGVPHVKQKPDFCGEACIEMYLRKLGSRMTQDDVFDLANLSPLEGRGCYSRDLVRAAKACGFEVGPAWFSVDVRRSNEQLGVLFASMVSDLRQGIPSIVCTRFDRSPRATEHFRLILGYDEKSREVIYHDPAVSRGAYLRMTLAELFDLWPLKYEEDRWTVIRLRLEPRDVLKRAPEKESRFQLADYAQHIMNLKKRLPPGMTMVLEPPFIVIGDESATVVNRRSEGTVRWAVKHLESSYFADDPFHIIDIWLFKDKASYRKHTRELFDDEPDTPFGYYSSKHRALIMNISTGGGTLVHEIVHPFMESNFSRCPSWFNEGLASLYEQCGERNGRIHGFKNWRLQGLQRTIRRGSLPSFHSLLTTTTRQFYGEDQGSNYGQARYLCYYLQEKGLLRRYFHEFRRNAKKDPGGFSTLRRVLGESDMVDFQKRWEKFVLAL